MIYSELNKKIIWAAMHVLNELNEELALVSVIPHTTALRANEWEVKNAKLEWKRVVR